TAASTAPGSPRTESCSRSEMRSLRGPRAGRILTVPLDGTIGPLGGPSPPSILDVAKGHGEQMSRIRRRDLLRGAAATAAGIAIAPGLADPADATTVMTPDFRGGNSRCTT